MMQAYEFNTVVRDGIIHVPKHFSEEDVSWVKVILLANPMRKIDEPRKKNFTAMRLKTKGFTFNREEAYACNIVYSEDMQHNQLIEGTLKIVNPFR